MLKKKKYAKNVNDEDGPDWGSLKKVDRPDGDSDDPDKKVIKFVSISYFFLLNCMNQYLNHVI